MKYLIIILVFIIIYSFKKDTNIDKTIELGEKGLWKSFLESDDD